MAKIADRNGPPESGSKLAGCNSAPAHKRMPKTRGFTEPQGFGNPVDGPFGFVEQQLGPFKAQVIEQCLVAAAHIMQMPAKSARRAIHLFGQAFKPGGRMQLCSQKLADALQPGLPSGELEVLFAAALCHRLVGNGIGQWQGLLEPAVREGKRIAIGVELAWAIEALPVVGVVVRCAVGKTCTQ